MATPSHEPPLVSVCMITYNHEPYIAQAIESVLMQQTDFPVELVIGEDCSTDNTRAIVCDYRERYPRRIHLLLPEYNLGMFPNFVATLQACDGRYIALLEGDDYWTDPFKLQKQVDFLEVHPEYGLVHTDCDFLYSHNNKFRHAVQKNNLMLVRIQEEQANLTDLYLAKLYPTTTATVLFRRLLCEAILDKLTTEYSKYLVGDVAMWLELSRITKFHYINEVTAVYRFSSETASHSRDRQKHLRFVLSSVELRVFFARKYGIRIPERLQRLYNESLLLYKTFDPEYNEVYPLIQPTPIELFFNQRVNSNLIKMLIRFWYWSQRKSSCFTKKL